MWPFEHKTLSPRPLDKRVLHNRGGAAPLFFRICGVSRHHHPLNPLNPLNLMNPLNPLNLMNLLNLLNLHTEGVSNGKKPK